MRSAVGQVSVRAHNNLPPPLCWLRISRNTWGEICATYTHTNTHPQTRITCGADSDYRAAQTEKVCEQPGVLPCLSPHPSIPADKNTYPTHTTPKTEQRAPTSPPSSLCPVCPSLFCPLFLFHLCQLHPISSTAPVPGLQREPSRSRSLSQSFTG